MLSYLVKQILGQTNTGFYFNSMFKVSLYTSADTHQNQAEQNIIIQ